MQNKLVEYFSKFKALTEEEKSAIVEEINIRTFKKGMIFLREGQRSNKSYFVLNGCVRQFYNIAGEEKTANFFTEEQWILSVDNFESLNPSKYSLSCVEDSVLVIASEEKGNELLQRFPKFQELSLMILEKEMKKQQEKLATFITDSPEQRYLKILEQQPNLIDRVPQYQLASYIGIQPESLSRIRKRITNKK